MEVVAVSTTRKGGRCRHCRRWISRGEKIHKVVRCCGKVTHNSQWRPGQANGPGVWVCADCVADDELTLFD